MAAGDNIGLSRGASWGRYVILDRVGAGSMGVVYAAYDSRLDRRVALKLLRQERSERASEDATGNARARLLREAQAMARLSNPNVITVYEAGEVDGEVYLAMEFVEGTTLRRWLQERERSWKEIVAAFLQAGRGLAAAHEVGIVHRDFKPDNVLVDREGRVRVTDFGIARPAGPGDGREEIRFAVPDRAAEATLTETGQLMGTPAYMAPEQLDGRPTDPRTDQFSFCVALYEALYGERPFSADTLEALAFAVSTRAVRPPPRDSRVPPWLRRALLRGLASDPAKRYPTMAELLGELAKDPLQTRRRWSRAGLVVVLALAGGAGVAYVRTRALQICRAGPQKLAGVWDDGKREKVRSAFLQTGVPYARDAWERVQRSLDQYVASWLGMYQDACEATHRRGEQSTTLLDLRMACLERRRKELGALVDVFAGADAKVVENSVQAAETQTPVAVCADTASLTGRARRAEQPAARKAVEQIESALARVKALHGAGKYADAISLGDKAVSDARGVGDPVILGESLLALEYPVGETRDPKRAESLLDEAVRAALAGRDDLTLAEAFTEMIWLAGVDEAHPDEGHRWARYAQAVIAGLGPGHDGTEARRLCGDGSVYQAEGKYEDARRLAEQCLALREHTFGADHVDVAKATNNLASAHYGSGAFARAADEFHRAAQRLEIALGPSHPLVATALSNEGAALMETGPAERERAVPILRRAIAIRESVFGADSTYVADSVANTGAVLELLGRHDDALAMEERAIATYQRTLGLHVPGAAVAFDNAAEIHLHRGEFAQAIEDATRAASIFSESVGADHPSTAYALLVLGKARLAAGSPVQALAPLEKSVAIREAAKVGAADIAESCFALARALVKTGRDRRRALELANRARTLYAEEREAHQEELREVSQWIAQREQ